MSDLNKDIEAEKKEEKIARCLEAINETQAKIVEEDSMRQLIKETLQQINEKEVIENHKKTNKDTSENNIFIKKLVNLKKILSKKKYKNIIIRIMMFLVMGLFMFNGALNRAYANDYKLKHIDDTELESGETEESTDKNEDDNIEKNDDMMVGVNEEGRKYSYDAMKICEKLKSGKYSNDGEKIVFLTFDDGTSTTNTPQILKVLDQYDVKATFFLMGKSIEDGGEAAKELVKKEFESGHAIGNHTYSHDYSILYPGRKLNLEVFKADCDKNSQLLKSILGDNFSTRVIRCPGGHMSWNGMSALDTYLSDNNMTYIDWNALSGDAEGKKKNADELAQYAISTSKDKEIVVLLMHDTYGKEETVKSLPKIIEYFKNNGYEFKTLA